MGDLAGFGSRDIRMFRRGTYYVEDPNADEPVKSRGLGIKRIGGKALIV